MARWTRRSALAGGAALAVGMGFQSGLPLWAQARPRGPYLLYLSFDNIHQIDPTQPDEPVSLLPDAEGGRSIFDGIAIDLRHGHIYWSDMGVPNQRDGAIYRCNLDGTKRQTIIAPGLTHTPKQLKLDPITRQLYWSDREGMALMRCELDGSGLETFLRTGDPVAHRGDQTRWCVGMALDPLARQIYWSQKGGDNAGQGLICRCSMDMPDGAAPDARPDIEVLFSGLPEPIDLDLDVENRRIYWTDRGDNTVSRAPMVGGA